MSPPLVVVAHGTRHPAGSRVLRRLARATAVQLRVAVHVAHVDVIGPSVIEVLAELDEPAVLVPAFLASGYHVRTDLPAQLSQVPNRPTLLADALGPAPEIAAAMHDRLLASGWRPGDRVVLAAAGSSDPRALADVDDAAALLAQRCGPIAGPGFLTAARPDIGSLCGADRVERTFVAPYLLAPGVFHERLTELAVCGVAEPIGAHPGVVDLLMRRYHEIANCGGARRTCAEKSAECTAASCRT